MFFPSFFPAVLLSSLLFPYFLLSYLLSFLFSFLSSFVPHLSVPHTQVFPHGTGFVLVFDYMLSDLSEVVRDAERPLTEAQIKSYVLMLLKGVAYCHEIG